MRVRVRGRGRGRVRVRVWVRVRGRVRVRVRVRDRVRAWAWERVRVRARVRATGPHLARRPVLRRGHSLEAAAPPPRAKRDEALLRRLRGRAGPAEGGVSL